MKQKYNNTGNAKCCFDYYLEFRTSQQGLSSPFSWSRHSVIHHGTSEKLGCSGSSLSSSLILSQTPSIQNVYSIKSVFRSDFFSKRGFILVRKLGMLSCEPYLFMVKTEITRKTGKFSLLLRWLSSDDLSYLHVCGLYCHFCDTPP